MKKLLLLISVLSLVFFACKTEASDTSSTDDTSKTSYTVTIDPNGGTLGAGVSASNSVEAGKSFTLPTSISNPYKLLASWNTAKDGSGTTILAGGSLVIDANTTIFAIWKNDTTKIINDLKGIWLSSDKTSLFKLIDLSTTPNYYCSATGGATFYSTFPFTTFDYSSTSALVSTVDTTYFPNPIVGVTQTIICQSFAAALDDPNGFLRINTNLSNYILVTAMQATSFTYQKYSGTAKQAEYTMSKIQ